MKTTLKDRLLAGILVLIVVGLGAVIGDDVTVQNGDLDVDGDLNVDDDADIGWDLDVYNIIYTGALVASGAVWGGDVYSDGDVEADDDVEADNVVGYSIGLFAKVFSSGGYDPPYVLYDKQTREQIIDRVKKEVYPDKQNGAALFFNADTKRLETYVASEGKFYDLQGNVTYAMPKIEPATTIYEAFHYVDRQTGMVETWQIPVQDKYKVKKGFTIDKKTGKFINRDTGEVVSREQALELYVPSKGNFYDLQGNLVRSEPKEGEIQYVTEYYFDRLTGEVKPRRRAVVDRYVIKEGIKLDRKTGRFIDRASREVVPREKAIELKKSL
jgi:hypothetical protein